MKSAASAAGPTRAPLRRFAPTLVTALASPSSACGSSRAPTNAGPNARRRLPRAVSRIRCRRSCRTASRARLPAARRQRQMVSLSAQRGHPVLLNFWATWCPPCVEEVPSMEDLARRLERTDIRMMAVSVDDSWDAVRQFFVKGTKMGVLLDLPRTCPRASAPRSIPRASCSTPAVTSATTSSTNATGRRPEAVACLESLR